MGNNERQCCFIKMPSGLLPGLILPQALAKSLAFLRVSNGGISASVRILRLLNYKYRKQRFEDTH